MSFNTSGSIAGNGFNRIASGSGFVSGRCAEILLFAFYPKNIAIGLNSWQYST